MQNYEVGQIVYLLVKGEMKVVPTRVVEAITRRRIEGTDTTYMVQFPTKEKSVVDLSEIDAEVYSDLDRVREVMIERVTTSIEGTIKRAEAMSRSFTMQDSTSG